jgi:outer membrane protein TolC
VGLALAVAADQADTRLRESRRRLRELRYRIDDQNLELAELLGIPSATGFELVEPAVDSSFTGSLEEYTTAALASNPEVSAASQQVERASQGIRAARAEYLPQVGVFAQHLLQHAVPLLPASHFSVGVKAEWTLWDFRQRDRSVTERRPQSAQAELDLSEAARLQAGADLIQAQWSIRLTRAALERLAGHEVR